jgi:hypothetical protein
MAQMVKLLLASVRPLLSKKKKKKKKRKKGRAEKLSFQTLCYTAIGAWGIYLGKMKIYVYTKNLLM